MDKIVFTNNVSEGSTVLFIEHQGNSIFSDCAVAEQRRHRLRHVCRVAGFELKEQPEEAKSKKIRKGA